MPVGAVNFAITWNDLLSSKASLQNRAAEFAKVQGVCLQPRSEVVLEFEIALEFVMNVFHYHITFEAPPCKTCLCDGELTFSVEKAKEGSRLFAPDKPFPFRSGF